jgi:GrpB-like predicted nucleotidyltransferase (UPF0157 family)
MDSNQDLHKMTTKEFGKLFPIIIQEPNKKWGEFYESERKQIIELFDKLEILGIEHIGSTAIPGIKAKPTIDILIEVKKNIDTKKTIDKLKSIGYQYIQRLDNPPPHMMFVKGYTIHGFSGQAFHVHIRYKGDWDELYFRDFLIENEKYANEYERVKLELAEKYNHDREAYTEAKTEFVEMINKLARKKETQTPVK